MRARVLVPAASILLVSLAPAAQEQPDAAHKESMRLIETGRYVEAQALAVTAFHLMRATARPCDLAALLFDQGTAEQLLTQYKEAAATFEHANKLCGEATGASPRFRAGLLAALGEVHAVLGLFSEASRDLRAALRIVEALPEDGERLARVHESLGVLAARQGRPTEAERQLRLSIQALEAVLGASHPDVAAIELTLCHVLLRQNRGIEAFSLAENARGKFLSAHGPSHPDSIFAALSVAIAQTATAPALAESLLRETLAAWPGHLPQSHLTLVLLWSAIGAAQLAQGHSRDAVGSTAQALDVARNVLGSDAHETTRLMYSHAAALKAAGYRKESSTVRAKADRIRRSKGYSDPERYSIDIQSLQRHR